MSTAVTSDLTIKREDLNPCTVKLLVSCPTDAVTAGFDKAIRDLGKRISVPGFRKGMAPRKMVEDALNPQAVYETAAENIVRKAFDKALEQSELKPEGQPNVEISKFYRGGEPLEEGGTAEPTMEFTMTVPLAPVVELADYKGLEAQRPEIAVSDEEIDAQIEELRRRQGKKQEVTDRGVQEGDAAVINLKADGEEGDGRTFMVIAGQTFEGLDKALVGMNTDEVKSAKLDFPENFQHDAWKGTKQSVRILVKSVTAIQMPDLDDAFAKGFDIDNVAELRERVKEGITTAKDNMASEMVRDQLLDNLLGASTVHVADNTWQSVVMRRAEEMQQELAQRGATLEDYVKANGMTLEEFQKNLEGEALVNVKRAVVIQKIFNENDMKITDEDVAVHFRQILAENNVPANQVEDFSRQFGGQIREEIIFRAMATKVTALLLEHAKITTLKAGEAPKATKPAKATKAKKEEGEEAPATKSSKGTKKSEEK